MKRLLLFIGLLGCVVGLAAGSAVAASGAPQNTSAPMISGPPYVGKTL